MIGKITIKRGIKRTAGWAAVLTKPFCRRPWRPRACILMYHRVADVGFVDPKVDDWNVPPDVFERQVAALAGFAEIVPLLDLPRRLALLTAPARPLVCLTFDDGYANFCTEALPILKRYQAPATVFVVSSLIGRPEPLPFDAWSLRNCGRAPAEAWRSMDWRELEDCLSSGLVTIGSHSHRHRKGYQCTPAQLVEEAEQSRAILLARLGDGHAQAYAYPYGVRRLGFVPPDYVHAVKAAGYQLAVTTDLGLASSASDPYLLPRLEAHAVDAPGVLRAKARGALAPYYLMDHCVKSLAARLFSSGPGQTAPPPESCPLEPVAQTQPPAIQPLRVLSVIPALPHRRSMVFIKRQVAALQDAGIVSASFLLSCRTSPAMLIRDWRRLRREVREFRPDLIHAHYGTMTAFFCAFSARLPLVVTYRGSDLNPAPSMTWLRSAAGRLLSQMAALRASQIICVSEQLKQRLLWARQRATVIPTGVDTRVFYPQPRDTARSELGWMPEERVVLFNASWNRKVKRLDLGQAAIDVAQRTCGEIRFAILEGDTDPPVVATMMNGADSLLVTSDSEGSPNIVKEAMACDLPVVTVDVGDVRTRLAGVQPSRIVDRDPEQIGAALAEVLTQGKRSNGSMAIQALSQDKISLEILSVYRTALGLRRTPPLSRAFASF